MQTQKCSKCEKTFDLTSEFFHKSSRSKTGFSKICKTCVNIRRTLWIDTTGYDESSFYDKCDGDAILARAKVLYSGLVSRSRQNQIPFDKNTLNVKFIYDWISKTSQCECCKRELDYSFKGNNNYASPTLDKFYPHKGYVLGNIHLLCWRCNILKSNTTLSKLEIVVSWMKSK